MLLLRCRDAIEELHIEIEEERKAKGVLEVHLRDSQQVINDLRMREKELVFQVEEAAEKNATLIRETQDSDTLRSEN